VTFRSGWQWVSIEEHAALAGPDDPQPWLGPADLPSLLRTIFVAAGGHHDDWDTFDAVMAKERRLAVLVDPIRVYSNPATPSESADLEPLAPAPPAAKKRESR
jgi:hypothetical protein